MSQVAQARQDIEAILKKYNLAEEYTVCLRSKSFNWKIPESVILKINSEFDNHLRNFAYFERIRKTSTRGDCFILKHATEILEDYPQRPPEADKYSLRWHIEQDKMMRETSKTKRIFLQELKEKMMKEMIG